MRLVSGGTWVNPTNVSSSPEATAAIIDGNLISMSQTLARAQAGQKVEMTLDVFFSDLIPNDKVVFDIQRGFIGSTQVEISAYTSGQPSQDLGQPVLLKTFTWDKTNKDNGNIIEVQLLADDILAPPTAMPKPNDYIVIAQLNLWYFGAGCHGGFEDFDHCSGQRTTPFEPALGHTYTSSDPNVLQQQIDWAADYGVDAFSLEWTTPRGVGTAGSLEDNIDDAFLKSPNLARIRWCIFYDTVLRMIQDPAVNADVSNGINFDDPKVYDAFVSDFDHFSTKYFGQPQYLTIDGRPVIYIYAAWNFHGNFAGAIKEARAKALAQGYDVFIAGDALNAGTFNSKLASQFDANTTFTFLIAGLPTYSDMGKTAPAIDKFFQTWRKKIQGLTVVGRNETVNFEPAWAPQFDNRLFDKANAIYVPALSKDQVTAMAQVGRDNAEPAGSLNQKLVWINTWNNWAEATTIEPTANQGARYPAGNYQFDMLEIVRDVFGAETFGNRSPAP
ncbi:MAG: glycoside hydrolase family 99-like domain-containing protein [Planctomycetes bacterium]|nr:glycoside hydrolase family 99-like domain-containing protein [Planctomycetota bacterium]